MAEKKLGKPLLHCITIKRKSFYEFNNSLKTLNYIDDKTVDIFPICFPWEEEEAKTMKIDFT